MKVGDDMSNIDKELEKLNDQKMQLYREIAEIRILEMDLLKQKEAECQKN